MQEVAAAAAAAPDAAQAGSAAAGKGAKAGKGKGGKGGMYEWTARSRYLQTAEQTAARMLNTAAKEVRL